MRISSIPLSALLALCLVACVSSFDDFDRDRRAYNECLEEHADDPSQCEELKKKADEHFEEYERESQSRWGCEQNPDRCNEPRPGQP
jgi:hypothetical protein